LLGHVFACFQDDARTLRISNAFLNTPEIAPEAARIFAIAPFWSLTFPLLIPVLYECLSLPKAVVKTIEVFEILSRIYDPSEEVILGYKTGEEDLLAVRDLEAARGLGLDKEKMLAQLYAVQFAEFIC
jgi:hypothetical protein